MKNQLNASKKAIRKAVQSHCNAQGKFVEAVAGVFVSYWIADRSNPDNLQFLLQELHANNQPRYCRAVIRLANMYTPCDISFSKKRGEFTVKNRKGVTAAQKQKMCDSLGAYDWEALNALLNHEALKAGSKKTRKGKKAKAADNQPDFRSVVKSELQNGVTAEELIEMLQSVVEELASDNEKHLKEIPIAS